MPGKRQMSHILAPGLWTVGTLVPTVQSLWRNAGYVNEKICIPKTFY